MRAYAARGRYGTSLRLRYRVSDNSGQTAERITVYRRSQVLAGFTRRLRATDNAVSYWVTWRSRKREAYRFCVRATDRAGNKSRVGCAAVSVR